MIFNESVTASVYKPLIMVLHFPVALSSAHQLSSINILLLKLLRVFFFYLLTQKVKVYSCGSTAPPASDNENVFPPCSIKYYFAKQSITITRNYLNDTLHFKRTDLADDETTTITTTKQYTEGDLSQTRISLVEEVNNHLETTQNTIVNKQRHSNKKPP